MYHCSYRRLFGTFLTIACLGCGSSHPSEYDKDQLPYAFGDDAFISADLGTRPGDMQINVAVGVPERAAEADAGETTQTVEEGDIYRWLGRDLLLNINHYRGLQIIDMSNIGSPVILGSLRIHGIPVEAYVLGSTAIILLNQSNRYFLQKKTADSLPEIQSRGGGVIVAVDLSEPSQPKQLASALMPGSIRTSRLTRTTHAGKQNAALYVAANEAVNIDGHYKNQTLLQSFDVSSNDIIPQEKLELGGYVSALQASPGYMMVASTDWSNLGSKSSVRLVDISSPVGKMQPLGEVVVAGRIQNQFNMDYFIPAGQQHGILRAVSSANDINIVQSFKRCDQRQGLCLIDQKRFGKNEQLYATLFLAQKAFFVTYFRTDPFHAFEMSADGYWQEKSEFIISGWNDFFRPVFNNDFLIGIGVNDEHGGRTLAVSLYNTDTEDLTPFIARTEIDLQYSSSEARWDHKAFSVIENAVSIMAKDGHTEETGLILLPFSGWSKDGHRAGVQIFSFSKTTITARGVMKHSTPVRRSFIPEKNKKIAVNLSNTHLSAYSTADIEEPQGLGSMELAPHYNQLFKFGDFFIRVKNPIAYLGRFINYGRQTEQIIEVVSAKTDPDHGAAITSIRIPPQSSVLKVGQDLLVVLTPQSKEDATGYQTEISVYDFQDPEKPTLVGQLKSTRLSVESLLMGETMQGVHQMVADGWSPWHQQFIEGENVFAVSKGLVFLQRNSHQQKMGTETICHYWAEGAQRGSMTCRATDTTQEICQGQIIDCQPEADGQPVAKHIDQSRSALIEQHCNEQDYWRYWQSFSFEILSLSDPSTPHLVGKEPIQLEPEFESVSILRDNDTLWITSRQSNDAADDRRPHVKYYVQQLKLQNIQNRDLSMRVNIPGQLLLIKHQAERTDLYTVESQWRNDAIGYDSFVYALTLNEQSQKAVLQAQTKFSRDKISDIAMDAEHLVLTHTPAELTPLCEPTFQTASSTFSVLHRQELRIESQLELPAWARLKDFNLHRALFAVNGGLLLYNIENATEPKPQAFFATQGWPSSFIFEEEQVLLTAGRYGIYTLDLATQNLMVTE